MAPPLRSLALALLACAAAAADMMMDERAAAPGTGMHMHHDMEHGAMTPWPSRWREAGAPSPWAMRHRGGGYGAESPEGMFRRPHEGGAAAPWSGRKFGPGGYMAGAPMPPLAVISECPHVKLTTLRDIYEASCNDTSLNLCTTCIDAVSAYVRPLIRTQLSANINAASIPALVSDLATCLHPYEGASRVLVPVVESFASCPLSTVLNSLGLHVPPAAAPAVAAVAAGIAAAGEGPATVIPTGGPVFPGVGPVIVPAAALGAVPAAVASSASAPSIGQ